MSESVPPFSKCIVCGKPSWNRRDIEYSTWKFKAYYCINCSPMTAKRTEEVKAEEKFLEENTVDDIPF